MIRWIFIGLGAVVLTCAIAITILERNVPIEVIVPEQNRPAGEISITGTMVCLPHRATGGPTTMECAYGLKGSDGNFYGLSNLNQEDVVTGAIATDMNVSIDGQFTPSSGDETYAIVGTIAVEAWSKSEAVN